MLGLKLIHVSKRSYRCPSIWQCWAISSHTAGYNATHDSHKFFLISMISKITLVGQMTSFKMANMEYHCTLSVNTLMPSNAYMQVNLAINVSDNGLVPVWCQAIIYTSAGVFSIGSLRTIFSGILIIIQRFSFRKIHLKCCLQNDAHFCLGLNVLTEWYWNISVESMKTLLMLGLEYSSFRGQYDACWCTGF